MARAIIDGLETTVAMLDEAGQIVMVNAAWREFARGNGGTPETCEGVGQNYFEICARALPDPLVQQVLDGMQAVLHRRQPRFSLEYPCDSPDKPRWMLMDVTGLDVGRHRLMVAHREVTRRVQAVAGLRDSEIRFRRLFDAAPLAMSFVHGDGGIGALNARFAQLFGYTLADVPKLSDWWRLAFPDRDYRAWAMASWNAAMQRAAALGTRIEADEYRVTCKDATQRTVQIFGIALDDGVMVAFVDVTARRRAEARLRLWAEAFEHAHLGLSISDARTNCFVAVNPAFAREHGYSQEELVGMPVMAMFPENLRGDMELRIAALDQASHDTFETEHLHKDGRPFPVLLDITVLRDTGGTPSTRIAYALDLSERKRAEAALRVLNDEMEELTHRQVARQTIAAIAHELNQPLTALATYSEAALRLLRAGNPQPERLQRALESGAQEVQRAGHVARELLSILKKGEEPTETVNVGETVSAVVARIRTNRPGGFQFQTELEPDLPPVRANRLQVEKVLGNLIDNGIEAMQEAGIAPASLTVAVRAFSDSGMAHVTVQDRGGGIDAVTLHRIFDPFFTTKTRGLGMGLAISRTIVEAHGGQLWCESEAGAGASFHLTLPFAQ
ncbi:MAG: PAS domain S-box protein [Rhodocyclaceae bacterium]